jgi:hypothetical protein
MPEKGQKRPRRRCTRTVEICHTPNANLGGWQVTIWVFARPAAPRHPRARRAMRLMQVHAALLGRGRAAIRRARAGDRGGLDTRKR